MGNVISFFLKTRYDKYRVILRSYPVNPIEAKELVVMKRLNEIVFSQIGGYINL